MKKRILSLILVLCLCAGCMSSCSIIEGYITGAGNNKNEGGSNNPINNTQNIDIENVNNYDITIAPSVESQVAASTKALLSAVSVYSTFNYRYQSGFGGFGGYTTGTGTSAGSGVIYQLDKTKGDAYIITNYHVVYDANSIDEGNISRDIEVYLYGQEDRDTQNNISGKYAIDATFIGGSMLYDIAILKVTGSEVLMRSNAVAVDFGNSDSVSVLDYAIAIGNPKMESISATVGFINVDSEYIVMNMLDNSGYFEIRVMRTDAAVNSGNSGGGLFDIYGRLIGIVNAKSSSSSTDNMGYAIPSNLVKSVTDAVIYYCDQKENEMLYRPMVGISITVSEMYTVLDSETGKIVKVEKIAVGSLSEGEVLAKGKLEVGDIINSIKIGDVTYNATRRHHVTECLINARAGDTVIFNITRSGQSMDIAITLTEGCLAVMQ